MKTWQRDKAKTDDLLPEARRILAPFLIREGTVTEDAEENADLVGIPERAAFRVRSYSDFQRPGYAFDFSVRLARPSKAKTEISKIIEGRGDWFLYGFRSRCGATFAQWIVGSLGSLRLHVVRSFRAGADPWKSIFTNPRDGVRFAVFDLRKVPGFVFAAGGSECRPEILRLVDGKRGGE